MDQDAGLHTLLSIHPSAILVRDMPKPTIAIQIVNYKTKSFLEPLLTSIVKDISGSKVFAEISILDNDSGDDLSDLARRWKDRNVSVFMHDSNVGFGAGHNILARKTEAEYILLLNPDMVFIEPDTVSRLLQTMIETQATVVGPRLLWPKDRRNRELHLLELDQLEQQPWDHGRDDKRRYRIDSERCSVAWVSGAAFLIRRDAFEAISGFDEKFFLYYEEVDLCRRLRKQGKRIVYNPHIQILHYGSASANKISLYGFKSLLRLELKKLKR